MSGRLQQRRNASDRAAKPDFRGRSHRESFSFGVPS
jgi:hypothetical protein